MSGAHPPLAGPDRVVLVGAGALGRDSMSVFHALQTLDPAWRVVGFVDDRAELHGTEMLGAHVLGGREWLRTAPADIGVLLTVGSATVWALVRSPGAGFLEQFQAIWSMPWGKQVVIDFYGLEVVLALFMISHAMTTGAWLVLTVCLVLMPFLGASAAAAYWILAVMS